MSNLIESVVTHLNGSGYGTDPFKLVVEKFNPTNDKVFAAIAKDLKMTGKGTGGTPDEIVTDVYSKFLNSKYTEGQAKSFMNMMMTFASKGYAPKLDMDLKGKLKKFLKSGMHLESTDFFTEFVLSQHEE